LRRTIFKTSLIFTLILSTVGVRDAGAQYMFLDLNGDGQNTVADTLGTAGSYEFAIWLTTDRGRDGAQSQCLESGSMTINSYEFIVRAINGRVSWGTVQNEQTGMTVGFGLRSGGSDLYCGNGGSEPLAPGTYKLASVRVNVESGAPRLEIVPDTPLGSTYQTGFGSSCLGRNSDNTLRLGIDWFDVGGIAAGTGTGTATQPVTIFATGSGFLYLGGNEVPGPWTLEYYQQRIHVNGLTWPSEPSLDTRLAPLSDIHQRQVDFIARAGSVADSLRRSRVGVAQATDYLAAFCETSGLGGRVVAGEGVVELKFEGLPAVVLTLRSLPAQSTYSPVPHSDPGAEGLAQLDRLLREGCVVFLTGQGGRVVVPKSRAQMVRGAIEKLRLRIALSQDEERAIPGFVQAQLQTPKRLIRD
jgi:hypothetical protein